MIFPEAEIEHIIVKYLLKEATTADLDALSKWICVADNAREFQDFVKTHYEITVAMNSPDNDKIIERLLQEMKKDKKPHPGRKTRSVLKYAAVAIFFLALGFLLKDKSQDLPQKEALVLGEESIRIEMENGKMQVINPEENNLLKDADGNVIGNQNKLQLSYRGVFEGKKMVYNTIHVPHGKRFDIILSDGTHVFLNSGTSLKYPIYFINGVERKVILSGEAYFDVAKDVKNPFVVNAGKMDIKVLGTKFNISNYPEDMDKHTVLVEGSIELYENGVKGGKSTPTLLTPGVKAGWNKADKVVTVDKVDTRTYTAWIDGKLIFRNTTFKSIRNSLERHYNITIKNNNTILDEQLFDATFDVETIEHVLESFNKSYAINYKIINNQVIIY